MTHVFAVVGLGLACMAWFLVQQWTGSVPEAGCGTCSECDPVVSQNSIALSVHHSAKSGELSSDG